MISALQNSKTNIVEDICLVCGGVPNLGINDTSAIQKVQDSFSSQYMKSGVDDVYNTGSHDNTLATCDRSVDIIVDSPEKVMILSQSTEPSSINTKYLSPCSSKPYDHVLSAKDLSGLSFNKFYDNVLLQVGIPESYEFTKKQEFFQFDNLKQEIIDGKLPIYVKVSNVPKMPKCVKTFYSMCVPNGTCAYQVVPVLEKLLSIDVENWKNRAVIGNELSAEHWLNSIDRNCNDSNISSSLQNKLHLVHKFLKDNNCNLGIGFREQELWGDMWDVVEMIPTHVTTSLWVCESGHNIFDKWFMLLWVPGTSMGAENPIPEMIYPNMLKALTNRAVIVVDEVPKGCTSHYYPMYIPNIVSHLPDIVHEFCQYASQKAYFNKFISAKSLATPFIVQYGDVKIWISSITDGYHDLHFPNLVGDELRRSFVSSLKSHKVQYGLAINLVKEKIKSGVFRSDGSCGFQCAHYITSNLVYFNENGIEDAPYLDKVDANADYCNTLLKWVQSAKVTPEMRIKLERCLDFTVSKMKPTHESSKLHAGSKRKYSGRLSYLDRKFWLSYQDIRSITSSEKTKVGFWIHNSKTRRKSKQSNQWIIENWINYSGTTMNDNPITYLGNFSELSSVFLECKLNILLKDYHYCPFLMPENCKYFFDNILNYMAIGLLNRNYNEYKHTLVSTDGREITRDLNEERENEGEDVIKNYKTYIVGEDIPILY